jgi:hypothetical protein
VLTCNLKFYFEYFTKFLDKYQVTCTTRCNVFMEIRQFKPNLIIQALSGVSIFLLKFQGLATPKILAYSGGNVFGNYFLPTSWLNLDMNQIYQSSVLSLPRWKSVLLTVIWFQLFFRRLLSDAYSIEII